MIPVRENTEPVVHAVEISLEEWDHEWTDEVERELQKHTQRLKAEGYVYVEIPDEELPF